MRLKNPGTLDNAISALTDLARELGNIGIHGDATGVRDAWLRWWDRADVQLRNLFADDDLVTGLYRTQAQIRSLDMSTLPLFLLAREQNVWKARLEEASRQLENLRTFVMRPGRITVPDTSALVEGERFWTADWPAITSASPGLNVRLIIPILVIEEMDELKRHRTPRVMRDARAVLRRLWSLPQEGGGVLRVSKQVTAEVLLDSERHVRLPVSDTEITDRALYLRDLFAPARRVCLIAADYSMLFRARQAGLDAIEMPRRCDDEDQAADKPSALGATTSP